MNEDKFINDLIQEMDDSEVDIFINSLTDILENVLED